MPPSPQGEGFCAQSVPTDAEAERRSPLPSSGLRGTPDATFPSRGGILRPAREGILRAVRSDGRKSATKITSSVIRLAGDAGCHPPLEGRDFTRSPLRRVQYRNENHLFRHPACGGRRMPPSPQGEGFCAQLVSTDAKTGRVSPPSPSLEGKVSPQATEEVSYRTAVSFVRVERLQSSKNIFHFLKIFFIF